MIGRLPYNDEAHFSRCGVDARYVPFPTMARLRCNNCGIILLEQEPADRITGKVGFDIEQFIIGEWP